MIKLNERVAVWDQVPGLYVHHEYFLTAHLENVLERQRQFHSSEEYAERNAIAEMLRGRLLLNGRDQLDKIIAYSRTDAFGDVDQISVAFHIAGESPKPWLRPPMPKTDAERLRELQLLQERAAERKPIEIPEPAPRTEREDLWGDK